MNELFGKIASRISKTAGSVWAFLTACSIVIIWASNGALFHYSTTWQLFINTTTTIVTFLMVFLIQNTQNRDSKAIHLKLDELIKGIKGSSLKMLDIENLSEHELEDLLDVFKVTKDRYEKKLEKNRKVAAEIHAQKSQGM